MSFASEFKQFALKGNVVDLAVGVIIGAAFGKIVDSLVGDVIMPIVGRIFGGLDFSSYYFPLAGHFLGFYVADVAGHGAASAFITAILTTLVGKYRESLAARGDQTVLSPPLLLARLDEDLARQQLDRHVAMFYGVVDTGTGQLAYSNAGAFPYPFLGNRDAVSELECTGRPLNLPGRADFGVGEALVEPGGRLLMVSDGVLDLGRAGGGTSYRDTRRHLAELNRRAGSIDDILAGLGVDETRPLRDDVALLFMRREERHA